MVPGEGPTGSEIADVERGSRRGSWGSDGNTTLADAGQDAPPTLIIRRSMLEKRGVLSALQRGPSLSRGVTGDATVCRCGAGCAAYQIGSGALFGVGRGFESTPECREFSSGETRVAGIVLLRITPFTPPPRGFASLHGIRGRLGGGY